MVLAELVRVVARAGGGAACYPTLFAGALPRAGPAA
jgi:hypothetical protein